MWFNVTPVVTPNVTPAVIPHVTPVAPAIVLSRNGTCADGRPKPHCMVLSNTITNTFTYY